MRVMKSLTGMIVGAAAIFVFGMATFGAPLAAQPSAAGDKTRASAAALGSSFEDRYANVNGIRLHYVIGGNGPPLLLIPGWPETWWSWRHLMPALAKDHTVIAVETRGMGASSRPASGYDGASLARDMFDLMDQLGHRKFAVVGHDIGVWIGYAMAIDRPQTIDRIALLDSDVPGITPSPPIFQSKADMMKTWHFMFNQLDDLPEALVQGREREFLTWRYMNFANKPETIAIDEYVRVYSMPGAMRAGFAYYRALAETRAQNAARGKERLTMPVLALGGEFGTGNLAEKTLRPLADDLQGSVLAGCGHFIAEECPQMVLDKLGPFLAKR